MADQDRIEKLRGLAEADPNDELAHFSAGQAMVDAGQFSDAGPYLQRVLALNSQNSKAYQLLGQVQKATGHPDLAIQTLSNGYRVAHRKGDLMPMKAMGELLTSLGAPIPTVAEKKEVAAGDAVAGFACRRCGGAGPKLPERPFKGALGEKILATVCANCWKEWVGMGTKVINELRLPMYDPAAQEQYDKYMKDFLMLD
ncbi:MAG TPA: Fe(2+)-trafficking protein [Phycisphaerae bacterium]|nr:Fe(2+)-trafficking protein [Phycisphaerae bacterium]